MNSQNIAPVSKYQVNAIRRVYILGDSDFFEMIKNTLKPLEFLIPTKAEEFSHEKEEFHFLIASLNIESTAELQKVARSFENDWSILTHKIIYIVDNKTPNPLHLFFSTEVGSRFTVFGENAAEQLRNHFKQINAAENSDNSYEIISGEIEACAKKNDQVQLREILTKINELDKNKEPVLRLLIHIYTALSNAKLKEFYLKKVLELNPQSLWAANELGKHYLRNRQPARGIEILEKLSQFHQLNEERLLELGTAYLNAGEVQKAKGNFEKAKELDPEDDRINEGLMKANLLLTNCEGMLKLLGKEKLSDDIISFLNTRAIMSIKTGKIDRGFELYEMGFMGAQDEIIRAKLRYNKGLGYVRIKDLEKARNCFQESVNLGGKDFQKAQKPLGIIKKSMGAQQDTTDIDEIERALGS